MKPISKKHYQFIQLVARGETFEKAYTTICNKGTTNGAIRSQGSRLAAKYQNEIVTAQKDYQKDIEAAKSQSIVKEALKSILSVTEVDAKLCSIIDGSFEITEMTYDKQGNPIEVTRKPTAAEVRAAIDTYYKRFGNFAPAKTDITVMKEIGRASCRERVSSPV